VVLRLRVLRFLRARLGLRGLPLRLIFWDDESFDLGSVPKIAIALTTPALLRSLRRGDIEALGDAYIKSRVGSVTLSRSGSTSTAASSNLAASRGCRARFLGSPALSTAAPPMRPPPATIMTCLTTSMHCGSIGGWSTPAPISRRARKTLTRRKRLNWITSAASFV
jgi:hypothetical protein